LEADGRLGDACAGRPSTAIDHRHRTPIPPGEKVEVVRADAYQGAVEDRDHFERALERIFHGSEDHAWEDAGKALDTRPSRRGGQ
jgi:hypothetical protein